MDSKQREILFLEMAQRNGGVTAQDVFEAAALKGSSVTVEAFHNLGRRLVARGMLTSSREPEGRTRYAPPPTGGNRWLDEEEIESMIDREDPVVSLALVQEASRQVNELPEAVWQELRERLKTVDARQLFRDAIIFYCDCLHDEVQHLQIQRRNQEDASIPKQEKAINDVIQLLRQLVQFGLGLSAEAVRVPASLQIAEQSVKIDALIPDPFYEVPTLEKELANRIEAGSFIKIIDMARPGSMVVAAVDSSIRGGLLAREGEQADFSVGTFPQVTITTAVGETNMEIVEGGRATPVFSRLPERPEDVQRDQNKYTVSAKIFYPDITDAEYVHLTWNAMDVLEGRMCLRMLKSWYAQGDREMPAADVVMKDGAVAPQDRDFSHYRQQDSYGTVVRDLIRVNWDLVHQIEGGGHTLCGVVKSANLRVFSPVLNWFAFTIARGGGSQIQAWPIQRMNMLSDQVLLSRLLTAGRAKGEQWTRSCYVLRPFHATTKFAHTYSRTRLPRTEILEDAERYRTRHSATLSPEQAWMAGPNFRGANDPYVKMLDNCWYAGFYLAAVARLDVDNHLPRFEFVVPQSTAPDVEFDWRRAGEHCDRLVDALKLQGFEVADQHSMFRSRLKLDVVPAMIIRVHERVKTWATVFSETMNEVVGYYLRRMMGTAAKRGIRCRPWSPEEFQAFKRQIAFERSLQAPPLGDQRLGE